jgi:hypothetical protein
MECKDYFQIIALIATIISSNYLVSRQIRKNKKSGWIEDFRREVAGFLSNGMAITPYSSKLEFTEFEKRAMLLLLLLDGKDFKQNLLIGKIAETTVMLTNELGPNHIEEFKNKNKEIITLAKEIIAEQTERL